MPTGDRGAVINVSPDGVKTLVLWRAEITAADPKTIMGADGTPLVILAFSPHTSGRIVETIAANLRFDDPDFPVTVLD